MKPKPSRTTNRLHFEDLDHRRFEDLCHALVIEYRDWSELAHPGRSGNDEGIDIDGIEVTGDGGTRHWVIQCKRYKTFTAQQAKNAIDESISEQTPPDVFLLVVACAVSKNALDAFKTHAKLKGFGEVILWDASYLESTLYGQRKDLLFTYFGVNIQERTASREAIIKKRIKMKERMRRDFLKRDEKWSDGARSTFNCANLVIRDINDDTYPTITRGDEKGISRWFKTEPMHFYDNGFEVVLSVERVIMDRNGKWDLLKSINDPREKSDNYRCIRVFWIGRIPFDNVVDYDLTPSGYGDGPRVFCRFCNSRGEPYEEEFVYMTIAGKDDDMTEFSTYLLNEDRVKLP